MPFTRLIPPVFRTLESKLKPLPKKKCLDTTDDGSSAVTEVSSEAVYDAVNEQSCQISEGTNSETLTTPLVSSACTEGSISASRDGLVDLGLLQVARGSFDRLKQLAKEIPDAQRKQYLAFHFKPSSAVLHSHQVTKKERTRSVSFQHRWLEKFSWLLCSNVLGGAICHYCILFPEQPERGGMKGGTKSKLQEQDAP